MGDALRRRLLAPVTNLMRRKQERSQLTQGQHAAAQPAVRRETLDAAGFEAAVLAYAQPLVAFAWRYLKSEDAAVDLVQDVFAHLWEHRGEVRIRGTMRAYLFAATRNRALNVIAHARIEARWRERSSQEGDASQRPPLTPDALAEHGELHAAVEAALRSLPPRAREIARLRWIDRLSRREIAEVLGIAVPTVSVHLTRTVKRLRGLLRGFAD
jgi:RNA polymerase sigma-70 factor, ECF subfamily